MRKVAAGTFSAALAWLPLQLAADAPERLDAQGSATSALVDAVVERHADTPASTVRRPGRSHGHKTDPAASPEIPPPLAADTAVLDTSGERNAAPAPALRPARTATAPARTASPTTARTAVTTPERGAAAAPPVGPTPEPTPAPAPATPPPPAAPTGSLLNPPIYIERDAPATPDRKSDSGIDIVWIALAGSAVALTAGAATAAARSARRRPHPQQPLRPDVLPLAPEPQPAPAPAAGATKPRAVLDLQWVEPPPRLQTARGLRVQFV